mmetsp:Transcript_5967/g.9435  ORF Transcript_5967/g.9435 Transcript_5967/m.9435 type:complete len:394 (+) Transcript_5967:132-1313(+)
MQFSIVLIVVAAFLTSAKGFATNPLSIPLRSITFPPSARLPSSTKLHIISKSHISSFGRNIFPPIPERTIDTESKLPKWSVAAFKSRITNQFNPKFIRSEFMFGSRYMLHRVKWLFGASLICHRIRVGLLLPILGNYLPNVMINTHPSRIHFFEMHVKKKCMMAFGKISSLKQLLSFCAIEEIAYRGIGHASFQIRFLINLSFNAWLLRRNIRLVQMYLLFSSLTGLLTVKQKRILFSDLVVLLFYLFRFMLVLTPTLELIKIKKLGIMVKEEEIELNSKTGTKHEVADQLVRTSLGNAAAFTPPEFEKMVQQSMTLGARVNGAFLFGMAHMPYGVLPLATALKGIQKGIGTFISSLLVESRLAVLRKNLWAPIGAHVAFNMSVTFLRFFWLF